MKEKRTIRTVQYQGYQVDLDTTEQIIQLDVLPDQEIRCDSSGEDLETVLPVELAASIAQLPRESSDAFISVSLMLAKAKQYNDRLIAAVELMLQGSEDATKTTRHRLKGETITKFLNRFGKRTLLTQLYDNLNSMRSFDADLSDQSENLQSCLLLLAASAKVSGQRLPVEHPSGTDLLVREFEEDSLRSNPIGFYTWNDELSSIFRRDRLLQTELTAEQVRCFGNAISGDSELKIEYIRLMTFIQRLTNPCSPRHSHVLDFQADSAKTKISLLPPSRSHESDLADKLYADTPIPAGFSLIDEITERVRSGSLDLTPSKTSGWYDYQTYALVPLLVPDQSPVAKKLLLSDKYREELRDVFQAALALNRETHCKEFVPQLIGAMPPPKIVLRPNLRVDPVPEVYRRMAEAYKFLADALLEQFGFYDISQTCRDDSSDAPQVDLWAELSYMITLFIGAYCASCRDIGLNPDEGFQQRYGYSTDYAEGVFDTWAGRVERDPDLEVDQRMMVPVYFDKERQLTKAWLFLGYAQKPIVASFHQPPDVISARNNLGDQFTEKIGFDESIHESAYPVMREVHVKRLLNREEFQLLCNERKYVEEIVRAVAVDA
jgi:hypothetical protein